jgi:predicted HTH transcriptional regulator
MKISDVIQQPEGRRLEFKQELPATADLAKTIVAFANDAGGDLYIGIQNNPRELVGIPEADLMKVEEQLASLIHAHCTPIIVPEISLHAEDGIHFIRVQIHRGSDFPYYLKSKGKQDGTYIRIGSTNRLADQSIIEELERRKRNISFDSELIYGKSPEDFNINNFRTQFLDLTGEKLDEAAEKKLGLIKEHQGVMLPTNALVLFADFESRKELFPYSKIECARFKGRTTDTKIDDKTINEQIGLQPAEALKFIQRHVDQGSMIEGTYTKGRWEYPMAAIREALRNAVVHRDYSLTGKDIKVAIYDDMVEITSPGTLPPSIDFQEMEARQSDIRNKVIAPIFKQMGVIDQWGNGLKIIANELKTYPEIEFKWFEKGLQFQVQFIKKNYQTEVDQFVDIELVGQELGAILGLSWDQVGTKSGPSRDQVGTKSALSWHQVEDLLSLTETTRSMKELMEHLEWKNRTKFRSKYITPLLELELLQMTIPDKPNSSKQQYYLTAKGRKFLDFIKNTPDS